MIIKVFPSGPIQTNAFLIACPETKQGAIIDAPFESSEPLLTSAHNLGIQVKILLFTHSHWDHIGEAHLLQKATNAPILVHEADAQNMVTPGSDKVPGYFPIVGAKVDAYLKEGQLIPLGNLEILVIHTPGHTPGGCCFYIQQEGVLFSGDTLFKGTIGRLDLSTGNEPLMWESLKKLGVLAPTTIVYPGHGPETTLLAEKWISNARERYS